MITIDKPNFPPKSVYEMCVDSVNDENLRTNFNKHTNFIATMAKEYDLRAKNGKLFTFCPDETDDLFIEFSPIEKKSWKSLYSQQMVPKSKPARKVYDMLLGLAPIGICPSCGFGHASTLDHYLAKSRFPFFSVLPFNLLPACKDCNTGKSNKVAKMAGQQPLHPYYDYGEFITEQWLFATVIEGNPAVIKYFALPSDHWEDVLKERAISHFEGFNLANRFSVQAANELSSLNPKLSLYIKDKTEIKKHLNENADIEYRKHKNSWKTAMYQALLKSDWYCSGGFNL